MDLMTAMIASKLAGLTPSGGGGGVNDYNKLENRPVFKEVTHSDTLTWDGNTEGLVSVEGVIYKVSDAVPTKEDCANGLSITLAGQTMTVPGEDVQAMFADDGFANLDYAAFVPTDNYDAGDDLVFPEAGVYFASADGMAVTELVIPGYTGFTATKIQKLDMDFLPDGYPYKAVERVEVLPETTVEAAEEVPIMTEIELVEGNTYTVMYQGTEYICVAQTYEVEGMQIGVAVGDVGMIETGEPTTGEPFLIIDLSAEASAEVGGVPTIMYIFADPGSTSITLSITGKAEVVHKMAGEYLPDGTPSVTPFDDVIMAEWPADIGSDGSFRGSVGTVIPGAVYKVNWGGTVYECVARKAAIGVCLGSCPDKYTGDGIATTDPFAIIFVSPGLVAQGYPSGLIGPATPPENNEFSVVGYLKVQKINEHCLPERKEPLFVTLSQTDGVYTADVPYEVMKDAIMRQNRMVLIADDDAANVFSFSYRDSTHYYFQSVYIKNAKVYIKTIDWDYSETITVTTQYINTEVVTEG